MYETACKSVCFVSFRQELLVLMIHHLCMFFYLLPPSRHQQRYRLRPFFKTGTGRYCFLKSLTFFEIVARFDNGTTVSTPRHGKGSGGILAGACHCNNTCGPRWQR